MADERINEVTPGVVETTDRGLFDFMKKKEDETKPATSEYDNINSGVEKVHISEPGYKTEDHYQHHEEMKHESLGDKLHRSNSSSSSSSDEEGDDEEKRRRKKERKEKKKGGIKEKIEEKFGGGHHKEEHDTNVPIEKIHVQENVYSEPSYTTTTHAPDHHHHEEEKKKGGFMDKIKDKLPGQHGDEEHHKVAAAPVVSHTEEGHGAEEEKEKKGFLDKIKEKIPGFHSKNGAEEKKDHDHHEEKKEGY